VAKPFSKIVVDFGEPFYIGKKDDMETARKKLEEIMIKQTQTLDASFGLPKIEAA
jgi:lysophospholipid acyltransferase (LPLAT)-like uncharacterized protein